MLNHKSDICRITLQCPAIDLYSTLSLPRHLMRSTPLYVVFFMWINRLHRSTVPRSLMVQWQNLPSVSKVLSSNLRSYIFFSLSKPIMFISGCISSRDRFVWILFYYLIGTSSLESPQWIEARVRVMNVRPLRCVREPREHCISTTDRNCNEHFDHLIKKTHFSAKLLLI